MGEAESNTASTAAVRDAVTEFTFWLDQLDQNRSVSAGYITGEVG